MTEYINKDEYVDREVAASMAQFDEDYPNAEPAVRADAEHWFYQVTAEEWYRLHAPTIKNKKHIVSIEFPDGGGTHSAHDDYEAAYRVAQDLADAHPEARVWLNDDVINRGFVASDERNWSEPGSHIHDAY